MDLTYTTIATKIDYVARKSGYRKGFSIMENQTLNGVELATLGDLATMLDMKYVTVVAWRNRYSDFPAPLITLNAGGERPRPLFDANAVKAWADGKEDRTRGYAGKLGAKVLNLEATNPEAFATIMELLNEK